MISYLMQQGIEVALQNAGQVPTPLTRLKTGKKRDDVVLNRACSVDGFSYFLMDITLQNDRTLRLIETNGSNAALSSLSILADDARAQHMFATSQGRSCNGERCVFLLCHQSKFLHTPEFISRAILLGQLLSNSGKRVEIISPGHQLGDVDISLVVGPISCDLPEASIAEFVTVLGERLFYLGCPVAFATNPNLLAELVRRGTIGRRDEGYSLNFDSVFHDGPCCHIVHDKGLQQDLCAGTGIEPLRYINAGTLEECVCAVEAFTSTGKPCVVKMNAGSGGAGVKCFGPGLKAGAVEKGIAKLIATAEKKYGPNTHKTVFPLRVFEFAAGRPFKGDDGDHLWDLRVQVLVSPGKITAMPCVIRLCPAPFDGHYKRESVVSNLTGRRASLEYLRNALDEDTLLRIGIDDRDMHRMLECCASWAETAWRHAAIVGSGSTVGDIVRCFRHAPDFRF